MVEDPTSKVYPESWIRIHKFQNKKTGLARF